jgi:hypothetical protein
MRKLIPALAAAALALAAGLASAQTPPPNRAEQICAKAQDPAKCQAHFKARSERMRERVEARQKAHEACNGKRGEELGKCIDGQRLAMRQQRLENRQKAHEACNGKRGDELMGCLREQREKSGYGRHGARG